MTEQARETADLAAAGKVRPTPPVCAACQLDGPPLWRGLCFDCAMDEIAQLERSGLDLSRIVVAELSPD